jgi:hypothetical protein
VPSGAQGGTQGSGAVAIVAPGGGEAGRRGRRHLTPEAKSELRGKRYQLEKKVEGRPAGKLSEHQGETARRLADQYQVSRDTIEQDGAFAEAVDTLEEVRHVPNVRVTARANATDHRNAPFTGGFALP